MPGGGGGGRSRTTQSYSFRKRRKCVVPKATFTTFMDEGVMHYRSGHYRKALFCFDRVRQEFTLYFPSSSPPLSLSLSLFLSLYYGYLFSMCIYIPKVISLVIIECLKITDIHVSYIFTWSVAHIQPCIHICSIALCTLQEYCPGWCITNFY